MKYCPYCGSYIENVNGNYCENCGALLKHNTYNYNNNVNINNQSMVSEGSTVGWGVLGFLVPLAGLILFIAWHKDKPKSAKSAGIGALIRTILSIIFVFLLALFFIITEPNYRTREKTRSNESSEIYYEDDWT